MIVFGSAGDVLQSILSVSTTILSFGIRRCLAGSAYLQANLPRLSLVECEFLRPVRPHHHKAGVFLLYPVYGGGENDDGYPTEAFHKIRPAIGGLP